jgi:F-type H+-transporting ATPase subunit b
MHIDWFVFFAQIVNFLILMALLKKFLYGRIISAMDAREARISATFAEAEKAREEASRSVLLCEQQLKDIQSASDEMINKARAEVDAYRRELMDQARKEVDEIQNRWTETLRSERENFFQELRRLTGTQVYAITRRVLKDLADMDLEQRIVQILTERIEMMNREERERIRTLMTAGEKITIQSAFDIPPEAREKLNNIIRQSIGPGIDVAYEKSEDVMSGYELRIDGYKIAWSMKDYLDTLEEKFYHVLYEESQERKQVH